MMTNNNYLKLDFLITWISLLGTIFNSLCLCFLIFDILNHSFEVFSKFPKTINASRTTNVQKLFAKNSVKDTPMSRKTNISENVKVLVVAEMVVNATQCS